MKTETVGEVTVTNITPKSFTDKKTGKLVEYADCVILDQQGKVIECKVDKDLAHLADKCPIKAIMQFDNFMATTDKGGRFVKVKLSAIEGEEPFKG